MTKLNLLEADSRYIVASQLEKLAPYVHSDMQSKSITKSLIKGELTETDTDLLIKDTLDAVEQYGKWGYRLAGKDANTGNWKKDAGYLGMGLTYNPRHLDLSIDPLVDPHEQVQGNHWPNVSSGTLAFSRIKNPEDRKRAGILNSHYDTYSIAYRTEGGRHKYLGTFLDSIKRTLIRTSIRIINSGTTEGNVRLENGNRLAGVTWHTDEQIFVNLRINIPIVTNSNFVLEQQFRKGELFHLEAPYAYSWDTGEPHRAYARTITPEPFYRTHIMLGIAPWWDFDEATHTWTKNEFHSRKHPLDMLVDGDIIPGFKLLEQI